TQFRQVSSLYDEVNSNIGQEVDEINSLTENLAKLNVSILNSGAQGSLDTPNDLLDQQERLLKDLSQHVGINVSKERNGMVSVYAGNGISLVSSDRAIPLEVGKDPSDPTKSIVLQNNININSSLSGGTLGGLFDFRNEMLDKTMNQLGRQATVLATTFNEQHRKGINLYEAPGGDFFRVDAPTVVPDYLNTGTGEVSAVLTDPTQLTSSDYQVKFTGGTDYEITRLDDSFTVTGSLPATIDGLEIKTTGSPAAGDMFLIQPTINGAKNIELSISNGSQIAAASPMRSLSNLNNIGDGAITTPQILDETNPDLRNPLNIKFTSPTDYEITDTVSGNTTTGSYTSNGDIDVNGLRIQITGSPAAGDSFTIDKNEGGSADNSNSRLLSELQLKKVVEGNATLQEGYSMIVNDVGGITRQTGIYRDAQNTLLANAEAMRDSISGVNLDEEAANLAKYQQAYQAAAQVIAISKSLFDTVLEATRR
ncbi:MAG TPA: flagellar hook-associated protein FlgK, partial [Gammaproteobacteria bacterium]|nr:flagellar hook-associated protein FlgK [Gammaproteobacteria bacterium]